jgi:hypothetical protein
MTSRMQLALLQAQDPRVVRIALLGAALVLALVTRVTPGAEAVYACPTAGGGGCSGG